MIAVADTDILSMFGKVKSVVDEILADLEVLSLSAEEHEEYTAFIRNEKYLHKGEAQSIIICKNRKDF